jgi:hypothetical protein
VCEGVGKEEEEEKKRGGRRRYGDENVVVFKMSFSSHGFPRRVPGIISLGRKQKEAFPPPEKVSNVY